MVSRKSRNDKLNVLDKLNPTAVYHIIIADGYMFEGDEIMLDDCFGITPDELESFCDFHDVTFTLLELTEQYRLNYEKELRHG